MTQAETGAAHKILDCILQDESIKGLGPDCVIGALRGVIKAIEDANPEKPTADTPKVSKQAMKAAREVRPYVHRGQNCACALGIAPGKEGPPVFGLRPGNADLH